MLIALDILWKYKASKQLDEYYLGYNPIVNVKINIKKNYLIKQEKSIA